MNAADLSALAPFITLSATVVVVMIAIALRRSHRLTAILTLAGLILTVVSFGRASVVMPRYVTALFLLDGFSLFFIGLTCLAAFASAALSFSYLECHEGHREEFYLLVLLATLGCSVLAAAVHFASFFLGIEILSVSLYALAGYLRHRTRSVEAGVKYLILAAVSSAFILFGMALVYAETGSLAFGVVGAPTAGIQRLPLYAGYVFIVVGIGFKLAVVPFHLWTPDVYEGAPAPVTAFIATASKGAVFALLLRYFGRIGMHSHAPLVVIVTVIAVASMFAGNLLALLQKNVKRILAYSSISHLGYLLVTLLASGSAAAVAAAFYLTAYFVTTLGAFGVVTMLSSGGRDADSLDDYRGLAWSRPWLAALFTVMLFSLAGIPLTGGFVGKFFVVAAGVGSALWTAVVVLVVNSVIGLFYYLRIVVALYSPAGETDGTPPALSRSGSATLAVLGVFLVGIGVYPGPVIALIQAALGV